MGQPLVLLSKSNGTFDHNFGVQIDGWIMGGGDRAPARGPRFGFIVLQVRRGPDTNLHTQNFKI
jgi:hypothetical protein